MANLEADKDYTYEVWLWIDENTWLETFTDADRAAWVSGDGAGTDITEACTIVGPKGYTLPRMYIKACLDMLILRTSRYLFISPRIKNDRL